MKQAFISATEVIPDMTHELGRSWDQPDRRWIHVSETHAMMGMRAFKGLHEYSTSNPSAVYEGKMWKRNDVIPVGQGAYRPTDKWWLCWYGPSKLHKDRCTINLREIILP